MERALAFCAGAVASSPHLEYNLQWSLALLQAHGRAIRAGSAATLGALRTLQKNVLAHQSALAPMCVRARAQYGRLFVSAVCAAQARDGDRRVTVAAAAALSTPTLSTTSATCRWTRRRPCLLPQLLLLMVTVPWMRPSETNHAMACVVSQYLV